jgi:hypothetical protein
MILTVRALTSLLPHPTRFPCLFASPGLKNDGPPKGPPLRHPHESAGRRAWLKIGNRSDGLPLLHTLVEERAGLPAVLSSVALAKAGVRRFPPSPSALHEPLVVSESGEPRAVAAILFESGARTGYG